MSEEETKYNITPEYKETPEYRRILDYVRRLISHGQWPVTELDALGKKLEEHFLDYIETVVAIASPKVVQEKKIEWVAKQILRDVQALYFEKLDDSVVIAKRWKKLDPSDKRFAAGLNQLNKAACNLDVRLDKSETFE